MDPGVTSSRWDNKTSTSQAVLGMEGDAVWPPGVQEGTPPKCPLRVPRPRGPAGAGSLPHLSPPRPCSSHIPGPGPGPTTSTQVKYPELAGPGFYELASLAGQPAPLPPSCFEVLTTTPAGMLGNVVRWLSCDPPFFLCHPSRPQPPCLCRKHPPPPGPLYLHPLIGIHFAALNQLHAERLLQGPQGQGGRLGRARGGEAGRSRRRNPG